MTELNRLQGRDDVLEALHSGRFGDLDRVIVDGEAALAIERDSAILHPYEQRLLVDPCIYQSLTGAEWDQQGRHIIMDGLGFEVVCMIGGLKRISYACALPYTDRYEGVRYLLSSAVHAITTDETEVRRTQYLKQYGENAKDVIDRYKVRQDHN